MASCRGGEAKPMTRTDRSLFAEAKGMEVHLNMLYFLLFLFLFLLLNFFLLEHQLCFSVVNLGSTAPSLNYSFRLKIASRQMNCKEEQRGKFS